MEKEKKKLIAANWKMHKTIAEAVDFAESLQDKVMAPLVDRSVLIAPPFTALRAVRDRIKRDDFFVGGQNCHWEEKGAFTGEVSPGMLLDAGCTYVILGHSERRHIFHETDDIINKKVTAALNKGLRVVLCVGELLEERDQGRTFSVVEEQLKKALDGVNISFNEDIAVAYEPVWAIGTGRTAKPEQAQEVHAFIRGKLEDMFNKVIASSVLILYGGSVKADNVDALMKEKDIDGLLVGGASLDVDSFKRIVEYRS